MSEQLSDEELKSLRSLILADARRQWVVSSLAGGARWLTALLGAWILLKEIVPWVK